MRHRDLRNNESGQVIVITALLVALVLLSTAVFVLGTEKNVPSDFADTNNAFTAYKQATRNTLISALDRVTSGGNSDVLSTDLNELGSVIASDSYQSIIQTNFIPLNQAPYQNGIEISWGTTGQGISSGYVTLQVNSTGASSTSTMECTVNVTTAINLSGSYHQVDGNTTEVDLTLNLQNEGAPALAQAITFYLQDSSGTWVKADSSGINDYGNGTYTASFITQFSMVRVPINVSAVCQDQRGITVIANSTCALMS